MLLKAISYLVSQGISETVAVVRLLDRVIEAVVAIVGRELVGASVTQVEADAASVLSIGMVLVEIGHLARDILLIGQSFILDCVLAHGVVVCLGKRGALLAVVLLLTYHDAFVVLAVSSIRNRRSSQNLGIVALLPKRDLVRDHVFGLLGQHRVVVGLTSLAQ